MRALRVALRARRAAELGARPRLTDCAGQPLGHAPAKEAVKGLAYYPILGRGSKLLVKGLYGDRATMGTGLLVFLYKESWPWLI